MNKWHVEPAKDNDSHRILLDPHNNEGAIFLTGFADVADKVAAYLNEDGRLVSILAAIKARIAGEYDHPALVAFGPTRGDTIADIAQMVDHAFTNSIANLSTHQLTEALRRQGLAVAVMQPGDVLSNFGADDGEFDESEEQYKARLDAAGEWLTDHAKSIEEAMVKGGFDAMAFETPPPGIAPITLDTAVAAFNEAPSTITAQQLRNLANEYCEDGMIEEDTRDQYVKETAPFLDENALTEAAETFKRFPNLAEAILHRRDDPCEATAQVLRSVAMDHETLGRITADDELMLRGLSELD